MARPTKYIEGVHDKWAASLAIDGHIDVEIAKRMGIAKSTLNKWKKEYPSFSDSLKMNKQVADARVKECLYKRALGYSYKEKKVIVELDHEGNQKPAKIETTEKEIVPDTTAQIFWLKNRDPDNWRDRQMHDVTVNPFIELMQAATSEEDGE